MWDGCRGLKRCLKLRKDQGSPGPGTAVLECGSLPVAQEVPWGRAHCSVLHRAWLQAGCVLWDLLMFLMK